MQIFRARLVTYIFLVAALWLARMRTAYRGNSAQSFSTSGLLPLLAE